MRIQMWSHPMITYCLYILKKYEESSVLAVLFASHCMQEPAQFWPWFTFAESASSRRACLWEKHCVTADKGQQACILNSASKFLWGFKKSWLLPQMLLASEPRRTRPCVKDRVPYWSVSDGRAHLPGSLAERETLFAQVWVGAWDSVCQTSSTGPTLLLAALDIWRQKECEHSSKPAVHSSGWSLESLGNTPQL